MVSYIPDRGDYIWLNFNPQRGHEQAGHRPAIVLSPKAYNQKVGLVLACPITSKVKDYPFEVRVSIDDIDGAILADQLKSLDWQERRPVFISKAPQTVIALVQALVRELIEG